MELKGWGGETSAAGHVASVTHVWSERSVTDRSDGLALAVHRGERGAVARLVDDFQDPLYGYACRLLGEPAEAQEATQDVFLRAHRALTVLYDEERCRTLNLRPWLFRIARNLCYNYLRARRARPVEPLPSPDGYHAGPLRIAPVDADSRDARSRLGDLDRAMAWLSPASRELVELRFVERMSYAEIAAILGGSEAAVRGKVFRTISRLRANMARGETVHAM